MVPPLSAGFKDKGVGPWDLWIWLNPFDLALLDLPEGTPLFSLYTALQKELKQITFPTAQMALVVIKVVPQTDVDMHEQQGKMQSGVDLTTEQVGIVSQVSGPLNDTTAKWMVGLLETPGVLVKDFNFIAWTSTTPSSQAVLSAAIEEPQLQKGTHSIGCEGL